MKVNYMNTKEQTTYTSTFSQEVGEGLTAFPKYLSSKYFYDKIGDQLFQQIMEMPEYYLTRLEHAILVAHKVEIANCFDEQRKGFALVELGAGDGKKTKVILQELSEKQYNFIYNPIDISKNAVKGLVDRLKVEMPSIKVKGQVGEYFEVLDRLHEISSQKKVILILGSNIGNLLHTRAIQFLKKLKNVMNDEDLLFIGFDQKKNPQRILDAYNDPGGITAAFNKNVLTRINTELGGNFDLNAFKHWETYDPESGTAKSFLVSLKKQTVVVEQLSLEINFEAWETIHTEISQKYDDSTVHWLAEAAGLKAVNAFTDKNEDYKNYLLQKS